MNATELTKLLTISENIQEGIQIAGDLWELSDFENVCFKHGGWFP